jgi:hypothetical protein
MTDLKLHSLTPSVFDQLAEVLWQAKAFEAPLAAALVPERWDAFALAAEGVPDERLERIRSGGLEGGGAGPSDVAEAIAAAMRQSGGGLISIEDMGRPGDAFLESGDLPPHAIVGDTLVYVAERPDDRAVERAWRGPSAAAGHVGLLTTYPLPAGEDPDYNVGAAVDAASIVVLAAYDGEGAVVFRRRS